MGTIVVGVDGSPGSEPALRWALEEARLRGSQLRVLHAYEPPAVGFADAGAPPAGLAGPAVFSPGDVERLRSAVEAEARALVEGMVQRIDREALDGVEIQAEAVAGPAAQVLIEAGRGAELLVLGSRGRGGFLGLLLGSVSQQCAQHPPCPVVILPPTD